MLAPFLTALTLAIAPPAAAQTAKIASASSGSTELLSARRAAGQLYHSLDRTAATLGLRLADRGGALNAPLRVFRGQAPLPVTLYEGDGAYPPPDLAPFLKRGGIAYHMHAAGMAIAVGSPRSHRLLVLEVPISQLDAGVRALRAPRGIRLEVASHEGQPLGRTSDRPPLSSKRGVGFSPVGSTGLAVLALPIAEPEAAEEAPTQAPTLAPTVAPTGEPAPATTPASRKASPTTEIIQEAPTHRERAAHSGRQWGWAFAGVGALVLLGAIFGTRRKKPRASAPATADSATMVVQPSAPAYAPPAQTVSAASQPPMEIARTAAGIASCLPPLREALATAERAVDRAYVATAGHPKRLQETAQNVADLTEQAAGLRERLAQACERLGPAGPDPRATSLELKDMALELALATGQPPSQATLLHTAGRLRELAEAWAQAPDPSTAANTLPYLLELATSLQARCERLMASLGGVEEAPAAGFQDARDALERGMAQLNLVSDRVRSLEHLLPPPEESV